MADAIGEAGDRVVAAIGEIGRHRIAERPAARALRKFRQRAWMCAFDRRAQRDRCAAIRLLQAGEPEQPALRRSPRAAGARRAALRRRTRGPPRGQPQPMNFADHCVAADADLGGDLTASQAGNDTMAELLDALRSPGNSRHSKPRVVTAMPGRRRAKASLPVLARPARYEASFRRKTAAKRHRSPSRGHA
jgi:hypothetical protein